MLSQSVNTLNQITSYTYATSGNMLTDGTYTYTWNGEGMLATGAGVTYTYDGDGERVKKSSGTYYWFSPSGQVLAQTDASGNMQQEYIYFTGRTARRDASGNVYYYFSDQVGTTQLITDASGNVCYDSNNTPFGYVMTYTNTCSQGYEFAEMDLDGETGNYHATYRQYEPNLTRWMSPDPLSGDVSNPQSLNRYAYVLNNPLSLTDPLGLDPQGPSASDNCNNWYGTAPAVHCAPMCNFVQACASAQYGTSNMWTSFDFQGVYAKGSDWVWVSEKTDVNGDPTTIYEWKLMTISVDAFFISSQRQDTATFAPANNNHCGAAPLKGPVKVSHNGGYGFDGTNFHPGVDYSVNAGTPVYSVESGTVDRANSAGLGGNTVVVKNQSGGYSIYMHMSSFSVSKGEKVLMGQLLDTIIR